MADFSLAPAAAGLIFVFWSLGFSVGSLVARRILAVADAPALLTIGSALACIVCALQDRVGTFPAFLGGFLGLGLLGGAVFTASHTVFGDRFPRQRTSALAILDVVFSLGNMAAPLVIVAIARQGWPWQTFFVVAGSGFAAVAGLFAVRPKPAAARSSALSPNDEPSSDGGGGRVARWLPLAIASFALGAAEWSQNVWFVTYAVDRGLSSDAANVALSCFTVGMILSRLGAVAVRHRRDSALFTTGLFVTATVGVLIIVVSSTEGMVIVGNLTFGAGLGALFPTFLGRAMDGNPKAAATCSTLMIVSLTLGGQAASFGLGVAIERLGTRVAFPSLALFVTAAVIGFETYRRLTREKSDDDLSSGPQDAGST